MIFLILILGLILRLINLNQSFWLDEAAQAIESQQNLSGLINSLKSDFHPPLYHLLTHFIVQMTQIEWQLRLLSVGLGVGCIYLIFLLSNSLFSKKIGYISALLLAINPFHIYFSQEFRPYILFCFTSLLSVYFLWEALKKGKYYWLIYLMSSTILFYTSYFGVFLILSELIFLVCFRRKILSFIISNIIAFIFFLPWIPILADQLKISSTFQALSGWQNAVSTPFLEAIPLTFVKFIMGEVSFRPLPLYAVVSLILITIWFGLIFYGYKRRTNLNKQFNYLLLLTVSFLALSMISDIFLPVVAPKRLIASLPPVLILLSFGISQLKNKLLILTLSIIFLLNLYFLTLYETNPTYQRENWRNAVKTVENKAGNESIVVFKFSYPFAPYAWYSTNKLSTLSLAPNDKIEQNYLNQVMPRILWNKKEVFLFHYLEGLTDPSSLTEKKLQNLGYQRIETLNFDGVGLIDKFTKQ